jgi:hypothetical protein
MEPNGRALPLAANHSYVLEGTSLSEFLYAESVGGTNFLHPPTQLTIAPRAGPIGLALRFITERTSMSNLPCSA